MLLTRVLPLFIFFGIFVIALIFSILNFHNVEIHLYFTTVSLPLVVALTLELIAGIVIGSLATFIHIVKLKAQYAKLAKKLTKVEKQLGGSSE